MSIEVELECYECGNTVDTAGDYRANYGLTVGIVPCAHCLKEKEAEMQDIKDQMEQEHATEMEELRAELTKWNVEDNE